MKFIAIFSINSTLFSNCIFNLIINVDASPSTTSFTSKIELHHLDVRYPDWRLGDTLLVVVVPFTPQALRLVPDFDEVLIVLNHDVVFVEFSIQVRLGAALVVQDVKLVLGLACLRGHVYAVVLINCPLKNPPNIAISISYKKVPR